MAPPRSPQRWHLIALILAALPTLLIAGLAAWILITWLAVRDRLGHWLLTVHDAHGVEQGQGDLDLVADQWVWIQIPRPPFVAFQVILDHGPCGHLTLSPGAAAALGATGATTCALENAHMRRHCIVDVKPATSGRFSIYWKYAPGFPQSEPGSFFDHRDSAMPPLTVSLHR
jgi:hypothetical protein